MLNKILLLPQSFQDCLIVFQNFPIPLEGMDSTELIVKRGSCLRDYGITKLNFATTSEYHIVSSTYLKYTPITGGAKKHFTVDTKITTNIVVTCDSIKNVYPAGIPFTINLTVSPQTETVTDDYWSHYYYGYRHNTWEDESEARGSYSATVTGINLGAKLYLFDSVVTVNKSTNRPSATFYFNLSVSSKENGKGIRGASCTITPKMKFSGKDFNLNSLSTQLYMYDSDISIPNGYLRWSSGNSYTISCTTK